MTTVIVVFAVLSVPCCIFIVAACILSSRISHEGIKTFEDVERPICAEEEHNPYLFADNP